jgi:TRAP-type uncharacterized transport system fused permease subunit
MSDPSGREPSGGRGARQYSDEELQDLVASTDSGARKPSNRAVALVISGTALVWSLFQLWIAQPQLWFGECLHPGGDLVHRANLHRASRGA